MKDKVLMFIIGFLVGAIVATGGFLIYEKTKTSNDTNNQFPGGNMPQMIENNGKMQMPPQRPEREFDNNQIQIPNGEGRF